ncbi:MAG: DUF1854 domain-containing protein [Fimbriimonadaceae bacterium]
MESGSTRYIGGEWVRFWRPEASSHLRAEIEGERSLPVAIVRRAFPQSDPGQYLSIQGADGIEIGILKSIDELDPASREAVLLELDRRYYTPKILAVNVLRQDAGMWLFEVETQRGRSEFYVRNWRDSAHETGPGRLQITSVDGQRFEIEDYAKLDEKSQALLEQLG